MVLYYSDLLCRYVERRVCMATHGYIRVTGVVADVYEDTVRLIDTMISDEHDDQGWFARLRHDDEDLGPTNPETLIHFHHITAVTCLDDDVQDLPPPSSEYLDRISGESEVRSAPPSDSTDAIPHDALALKLGVNLLSLVRRDETQLLSRITDVRQRIGESLGFRIPQVRIRDDIRLDQSQYEFNVGGCPVDSGTVFPGKFLALGELQSAADKESPLSSLGGDVVRDPVYDLPGVWIDPSVRERAELAGCTIVDPAAVISVHLQELIRQHASELLDAEQVANAIETLRFSSPHLVADVYPSRLALGQIHHVLCQLLSDGVSIGWLDRILERLSWQVSVDGSLPALVNAVRRGLGRSICAPFTDNQQTVRAYVLDPALEEQLSGDCSPALIDQVTHRLQTLCREDRLQGTATALLVSDKARWSIQERVAAGLRRLTVIASGEVPRQLQIEATQVVSVSDLPIDKSDYKQLATPR